MKKHHCFYCILIALSIGILIGALTMYKNLDGKAIRSIERNQEIVLQMEWTDAPGETLGRGNRSLTRFMDTWQERLREGD